MSEKKNSQFMDTMRSVWQWVYRLRSLVLAVPVAIAAVVLAIRNSQLLPAIVTFDTAGAKAGQLVFQSISVGRATAVVVPLILTFGCLVMMFCSKKVVYPWLISLFSLVLPLALLLINTFP